ncbi:MAG: uracil-DNA glycosylase [Acidobacteriota bacterium]|nr:uracil-DNA glycosylase [Acidobacteriota bacterium]
MPSEIPPDIATELHSLTRDVREQLTYLHELGIENLETSEPVNRSGAETIAAARLPPMQEAARPLKASPRMTVASPPGDFLFGDISPAAAILERSSESLEEIWADIGDCTRCPLYERRTHVVHTEGNRKARLMFVGEAPGADEDAQARPFVGRAGQLLTKIIEAIGLKREEVLIGNVNRCRPPGNRPPTPEEASTCKPFLLREIAAVQPEVIVVLGNTATRNLLGTKEGITRLRGHFQDYQGVKVMPTFHPAYLLRDPSKKQETWQDLKKVRDYLENSARRQQ